MTNKIVRIGVIGSYYATDGYPNVKWLLDSFNKDERFHVYTKYSKIKGVTKGLSQIRNKN